MGHRRIAVLAPFSTIDHQTGVLNAVRCFVDAGFDVDVFTVRSDKYAAPELEGANIFFIPFFTSRGRDPRVLVTVAFAIWMSAKLDARYVAVFAGGIRGLVAAWISSRWRPLRIINLQLELYVGPRVDSTFFKCFKWVERRAIRYAWRSLIHDECRAEMLCADAGISRNQIIVVPNAPLGPGKMTRSTYLQKRLGIPDSLKILLAPGSIGTEFCSAEIVVASQALSDDYCCVVHSAQPIDRNEPIIRDLESLNTRRKTIFSLSPVRYQDLANVLASARIGLAVYGESGGENTTRVGLASGKLCEFLRLGVPVIVSDHPGLGDFVRTNRVGVAIGSMQELPAAIEEIERDHDGYRARAVETFDSCLAFERHFSEVIDAVNGLTEN